MKTAKRAGKCEKVEANNKEEIKKLIAEAEDYLAKHYKKDYYDVVNNSCKAAKAEENSRYEKVKADLKSEHQKKIASLKDAEEIKAEKYVLKNKLFDAQMAHESKLQEIKDRRHEAFMHKYHLIDLLRTSKFTFPQQRAQKLENYRYSFNLSQFLYKNGLYIVIILIFIALCIITPIVKKYTAADRYQYPEYLTAGIPAYVPCTWCCRPDPVDRYGPFGRTYGWSGYGYSNHYHA